MVRLVFNIRRNLRILLFFVLLDFAKNAFAGPSSTFITVCHKYHTVTDITRKSISWVTTIMVIPPVANSFMTRNTPPTILRVQSGSRFVKKQHQNPVPLPRRALWQHRCFCPPWTGWTGYSAALFFNPTRSSNSKARTCACSLTSGFQIHRGQHDVLFYGQMRKQIKMLESTMPICCHVTC